MRVGRGMVATGHACVICHSDDWCMESLDGEVCICMRIPSESPLHKGQGGYLHRHPTNASMADVFREERQRMYNEREAKRLAHIRKQAKELAEPEVLDQFHNFLLKKFPLKNSDWDYLVSCGITNFQDYGSLPVSSNDTYTNIEIELPFETSKGIPGVFYSWDRKKTFINTWAAGLFRVIRNKDGLAVGCEIRLSDECKAKRVKYASSQKREEVKLSKYEPLSSSNKEGGYSADTTQYAYIKADNNLFPNSLLFTEGAKKAEVAANYLNMDGIGARSVANWKRFADDLLLMPTINKVYIAFDQDKNTNPHVMACYLNLINQLKALNRVEIIDVNWDEQKGIDDAILNNAEITFSSLYKPTRFYTLEEVDEAMEETITRLLRQPNHKLNIVTATVGGGKTTGVRRVINNAMKNDDWFRIDTGDGTSREARVLWLADNHKLLEESQKEFVVKPPIMKGRNPNELDPFYCAEYELTQHVGNQGQNVTVKVCLDCPLFQQNLCSYQNNTKRILKQDRFVMATKASFFNKSDRIDEFDIIIVDESITGAIYDTRTISLQDIALHKRVISQGINYTEEKGKNPEGMMKTEMLLEWFETMLLDSDKSELAKAVKFDIPDEFKNVYSKHEKVIIHEADVESGSHETHLKAFVAELDSSAVYVWKDRIYIDVPNYELMEKLNGKTIINLDATASDLMLSAFGKHNVVKHEFRLKEYINIIQDTALKCSKRQLADERTQQRLLNAIQYVVTSQPDDKVSLISSKYFVDIVDRHASTNGYDITTGWYGYHSKGFNFMEDADTHIIVGNFCRNLCVMEMRQQTMAHMGIKLELDEMIEEDSLAEIIQSIGRGRACRREDRPLNLFLFTNRDVSRYYPDIKRIKSVETLCKLQETNQQKANEVKEAKAMSLIQKAVDGSQLICNTNISELADELKLDRKTVAKHLRTLYKTQLIEHSKNGNEFMEHIDRLSDAFKTPSLDDIELLGIQALTYGEASILYNIYIDDAAHVIVEDNSLYELLKDLSPAGIGYKTWICGLNALHNSVTAKNGGKGAFQSLGAAEPEKDVQSITSILSLAEAMNCSRQTASKFFNQLKIAISNLLRERYIQPDKQFNRIDNWNDLKLEGADVLRGQLSSIANAWHEDELTPVEVTLLSTSILDAVEDVEKHSEIFRDLSSDDCIDIDTAIFWRDTATTVLVKHQIISDTTPAEFLHPAYYLEQLACSLIIENDEQPLVYSKVKRIYDNWRTFKYGENIGE